MTAEPSFDGARRLLDEGLTLVGEYLVQSACGGGDREAVVTACDLLGRSADMLEGVSKSMGRAPAERYVSQDVYAELVAAWVNACRDNPLGSNTALENWAQSLIDLNGAYAFGKAIADFIAGGKDDL